MDDAMEALFQIKPDYEYLKDLFDKSTDTIAKLMYLLSQYVNRTQDLELIEKIITGEIDEEMENLDNEENTN
jgi:glycogen debranching enzyme